MREKIEQMLAKKIKDRELLNLEYDRLDYTTRSIEINFSEEMDFLECEINILRELLKD